MPKGIRRRILRKILVPKKGRKPKILKVKKVKGKELHEYIKKRHFYNEQDLAETIEGLPRSAQIQAKYEDCKDESITESHIRMLKNIDEKHLMGILENGAKAIWIPTKDKTGKTEIDGYIDSRTYSDFESLALNNGFDITIDADTLESTYSLFHNGIELRIHPVFGLEGAIRTVSLSRGIVIK